MKTTETIETPIKFLHYVLSLPMDGMGAKLDKKARETCGLPLVATIALIGLSRFTGPTRLGEVNKVTNHNLTPATIDGLVRRELVRVVNGTGLRAWQITPAGVTAAAKIEADLKALITKLTRK
jgi:hypothetical protein